MSHLSTLIDRIEIRKEQGMDDVDKTEFQGRLMNLAEYLTFYDDWTEDEMKRAKELLEEYNFDVELTGQGVEKKIVEMRGLPDVYRDTCMRCGRALSNPYSKRKGLGPVCRMKVKRGDWGKEQNKVMEKAQRGVAKLQQFGIVIA